MNANSSPIRRGSRPPSAAPKRLFCLPPAGAGPSLYYPWIDKLAKQIDVCPLSLPGREDRMQEPLAESIGQLADDLAFSLAEELDERPFALFGYSMGAMIAYELALRLQITGMPQPQALIVLAARAPACTSGNDAETPLHQLQGEAFKNMLRDVGGTPEEILQNEAAMALFEPILRNDFRISETWERDPVLPLNCPIQAFHCLKDSLITESDLSAWQQCTRESFELKFLDEPHLVKRETLLSLPNQWHL